MLNQKMNDKKIGIITVHRNVNYGANLQAFASCKFLNNLGYKTEIIDYLPNELDKDNYLFSWLKLSYKNGKTKSVIHNVKLLIALVLSAPSKYIKLKSFYNFRKKHCKLSPKYINVNDIGNNGYTDVVCGSDQIWNPDITNGIISFYFGQILGVKNKISYAASLGKEKYNDVDENIASELLKKIDYISVREEESVNYIKSISSQNVECVCDPVFLLKKNEYEKIAIPIKVKRPYLLVYSVINNPNMLLAAKKYAAKKGMTLVEICQNKKRNEKHIQLCSLSPQQFLGAIKDAEIVVTNSFHGTAFSIIFNKELFVFDNKARGSRITNIMSKAGLEARIVENEICETESIDYNIVKNALCSYIDSSKEFLITAVSSKKKTITENCVGCGACKAVCKFNAISIVEDECGFIKSYIDSNKCVDCGACCSVCPTVNVPLKNKCFNVFAFKAKDALRVNSTSGGAAAALSEAIIKSSGCVYGASLDDDFNLKHIRISRIDDIVLLQGTKYIQSDMTSVFDWLKRDLKSDKPILFIGTPCQVAAVKNFVLKQKLNAHNLYLCDIICHGVPSPKVFKDYISWLSVAEKNKVNKYYFRNKNLSWRGDSSALENETGELKHNKNTSAFMNLYYSNNITCDACFNCKFTSIDRVGDITISDFWGIENENADFEDALGVSMILLNTPKGIELFNKLEGQSVDANIDNAKQPQLKMPSKKPESYDVFWRSYKVSGINNAIKNYGIPKTTLKTILYNLINRRD